MTQASAAWPNGISVPLTTPFKADETVDTEALAAQVVRLAKAGVGIVLLGTNGEASHLSPAERFLVIQTGRKALDDNGFADRPLLAGTGGEWWSSGAVQAAWEWLHPSCPRQPFLYSACTIRYC